VTTMRTRGLSTAEDWSIALCRGLDFVAILALAGTLEVHPGFFLAVGITAFLSWVNFRFGKSGNPLGIIPRLQLIAFIALVAGSLIAWLVFKTHPIIAAAQAAPLAHALTWFSSQGPRTRGWRIGLGFVELILASALTAEFYLPLAVILFVVLASVALSCNFLHSELSSRAPAHSRSPLPPRYIQRSIGLAMLIFLTSAVIFPILPRNRSGMGYQNSTTSVGYTEEIKLGEFSRLDGNNQGHPVLRLYFSEELDLSREIYLGLIRGKVLGSFDGESWKSAPPVPLRKSLPLAVKSTSIEIVREPIGSSVLPVPYGTLGAWTESESGSLKARFLRGEQWVDPGSEGSRVHYRIELPLGSTPFGRGPNTLDEPLEIHRRVPTKLSNERLKRLSHSIFSGARSDRDKMMRVAGFFQKERFTASVDGDDEATRKILAKNKLTPLENFLFIRKAGHCELFASSAAVLLRLAGVPTRLIAGFRISKAQVGGVLTVRDGDAHAWLEAWSQEQGWIPMDPTPRDIAPPSIIEYFRTGYDLMSAYWYRYVMTYRSSDEQQSGASGIEPVAQSSRLSRLEESFKRFTRDHKETVIWTVLLSLVLGLAAFVIVRTWFPWLFSIQWRVREGSPALRRERLRMEKLLGADLDSPDEFLHSKLGPHAGRVIEWRSLYQNARFGRAEDSILLLRNESREIHSILKSKRAS
jgi:protein-glutamine gamma-glutamyltransferase